jgi:serine/threonine protein kinase
MTEQQNPDSSHTVIDPPSFAAGAGADIPEDPRIVEVVQEYLSHLEKGELPDRESYVRRYPELATAVAQCLEGLDLMHAESKRLRGRTGGEGSAPKITEPVESLPESLGDFRIVRELARGGMGVVYEAVQLSLARRVALKVLPFAATLDARHLQRFKTEAQAAALLHHTNIVPVYAVGCERGVHFYAMQLIEGQSLAVLIVQLRRQAGLPTPDDAARAPAGSSYVLGMASQAGSSAASRQGHPAPTRPLLPQPETTSQFHAELSTQHAGRDSRFFRTAARLMLQAAQALEHAHEFGIVHRDIKPANLLLDTHGVLWVADFGLAQFHADTGLTRTGDIPGTLRYMSPEQASGQRTLLDRRTDVYSLGATFYEVLTLEPIFRGRDVQYLLHQVLHTEPRPLRQVDKAIPVELETIILKSVSKNPDDRYRSAGDLAADLQRYLDHQPILARRPSLVERVRKWSRRHPSVVVSGMLLLSVIAIALFISNRREQLRANEAERQYQQARRIVDDLFEVSEEELADNRFMQGTRQRLLGIVLGYYQDFIDEQRGDAASQAELAKAQERVRRILDEMGIVQRSMRLGALDKPAVQKALDLTDDEHENLVKLLAKWKEEWGPSEKEMGGLSEDARRQKLVVIAQDHDRALEKVLSPKQRQRLGEVVLQFFGLFTFKDPDVVDDLKLTKEQRKKIREIEREIRPTFGPPGSGPGPGRGAGGWRGGAPRLTKKETVNKVLALLNDTQLQKWKDLTGLPFADDDESPIPWMPAGPPPDGRVPPRDRRGPSDGPRREPPREDAKEQSGSEVPDEQRSGAP